MTRTVRSSSRVPKTAHAWKAAPGTDRRAPDRKGPRSAGGSARTECRGPHGRNSASVTANLGTAHELEEVGLCHRTPRGQRSGFLGPPRPAATEPMALFPRGSVGNAHPQPSGRPTVTSDSKDAAGSGTPSVTFRRVCVTLLVQVKARS